MRSFALKSTLSLFAFAALASTPASAQVTVENALSALSLREVGPAAVGGRIADIKVDPENTSVWYLAVGSGGVWKTTNAGTTWTPLFDDQPTYSVGTIAIDPTDSDIIWVGTGENVSGRHVGWGSGMYRSLDAGETWEQRGLEDSEHLGKILIHPKDGNVALVAAEGPLWASGGQRGIYKTTDAGKTWVHVLDIDENTGVTDLEFDPSDPDVVYAAAYQRRRHIWGLMSGGPNSGIYKSTDGGDTWREVTRGLPTGDMGKIGLAVTPAAPSLVYATIEADGEERGFYRSTDNGESWEHRNGYISGGTGPHYYQEIEASPTEPGLVIQMDVFFQITRDGGETFDNLGTGREKHSDNHALWIDPENTQHMLAGTDAGPLRDLRSRHDMAALPEPADLAVLQGGPVEQGAFLRSPRRCAGSRHALGSVAHHEHRGGAQLGLAHPDGRRRLRCADRPHRSRHPVPDDATGESVSHRSQERRVDSDPASGGSRRPGRTLELGLPHHHQPARLRPPLLRLSEALAQ